ncbi:MAG: putative ral secretion pathway protein [Verrucomicrobiota bacterium]
MKTPPPRSSHPHALRVLALACFTWLPAAPLTGQAPPNLPQPTPEVINAERAAAEAARAARALPTPIPPATPSATPARPAGVPALPPIPTPGKPAATGPAQATNRPTNIQFTPRTAPGVPQPVAPTGPAVPGTGPGAGGTGTRQTNVTAEAIRAAAGAGGAGAAGAPGAMGAVGAGAAGQAGAPGAAAGAAEEETFPPGLIKFSEADMNQVLDIYQELTGKTVVRSPTMPAAKITVKSQTTLTKTEAIQLLETLLAMNQITMVPQGDKFVRAVPEAAANTFAKRIDDLPADQYPESATLVTHIVQLKNAAPNDLVQVLQPFAKMQNSILTIPSTSMLVIRDYAENVKRMLEMINKIDIIPPQDFIDVVIPIKYALAGDIAQVLGSLTAGGGGTTTVGQQQTRTGISSGGRGSSTMGGGMGGMGGMGQPGYNPANPLGQQQAGMTAGGTGAGLSGRSSFASRLNNIINRAATGQGGDIFVLGQTKIIADERTNSLLIFASRSDLMTISNIINKLDVVLAQVLIEAIIMEVKVGDNLDYGFSYLQKNPTDFGNTATGIGAIRTVPFLDSLNFNNLATNSASGLPGGFSYVASFMNFDATLKAMSSDSRVNIISRPRIQTSHAVEANLFVGQTRPYVTGTYTYFGGGPQTQFQQQQIGLTLSVLPLINAEGLVVMDINIRVQNIGEDIPIDATFSVPETIDREAAAKVAVRDRETIMLGGFISKQKNVSKSGVPILKDIPYVGNLFRSTSDENTRVELITLIRPTVLPSPKDAALIVADEKRGMPAVRAAERDYQVDTDKRVKADDRQDEIDRRKAAKDEEREQRRLLQREGLSR